MKLECLEALEFAVTELHKASEVLEALNEDDFCYLWCARIKTMRDNIQMAVHAERKRMELENS